MNRDAERDSPFNHPALSASILIGPFPGNTSGTADDLSVLILSLEHGGMFQMNYEPTFSLPVSLSQRHLALFCLFSLIPVLPVAALAASGGGTLEMSLLWIAESKTYLETSAMLADLNGDGLQEGILAGREELIAIDGAGKELWRWRTPGRFITYPAVLMRANQSPLIYAADNTGRLTCVDGTGKEIWHAQLNAPTISSAAVVCDLNGDGVSEVLQTDERGTVWCFNSLTGTPIWQAQVSGIPVSPAVGDLNADGTPEIVVATGAGLIFALDRSGAILWEREIGGTSPSWSTSAPVIFGASDGSARVVAGSGSGRVFCLDGVTGNVLWKNPTCGPIASTISVGDPDLDGRADIFLITQLGVIYRYDEQGTQLSQIDMQGRSLASGSILDVNSDGRPEYVFSTQQGHLMVLDNSGDVLFDYQFPNRTTNSTPIFGDMTKSSPGLEMLISGGESGKIFCFKTPAKTDTLIQWGGYRCTPDMKASWLGLSQADSIRMVPQALDPHTLLTGQDICFSIYNPVSNGKPLKASADIFAPDGSRRTATTFIVGKYGELRMRFIPVAPGLHRIAWTLAREEGTPICNGTKELTLIPFANDRAVLERTFAAITDTRRSVEPLLPLSASALERELALMKHDLDAVESLQTQFPNADAEAKYITCEKTSNLIAKAARIDNISRIVSQSACPGATTSIIPFEGLLWENRAVDEQIPTNATRFLRISRTAVPTEHEVFALNLFNITDRAIQTRILVETSDPAVTVTPRHAISVPTSLGAMSWDPLPTLDQSGVISIPPLSTRQIWLDVVAPTTSGKYRVTVRCLALNGAGVLETTNPASVPPPEAQTEIDLDVLAFEPAPPGVFRLCTWASAKESDYEDLLSHGNNVFVLPLPQPKGKPGEPEGIDSTQLDAAIRGVKGHDVVFLLQGMPNLAGKPGETPYQRELETYLKGLVAHLSQNGIDKQHFALYPFDEPGGFGWNIVNQYVDFGKAVRKVDPAIQIYMDGGGELPMFEAMAPVTDIWCPGINMLPEPSPEMKCIRGTGKTLWSYNCSYSYGRPIGAYLKNTNIVAEYRIAALFAFRYDATGIGYWCYNHGEDPWGRTEFEYMLIYPTTDGPVTSRRWEAVREGIEDYRILNALRSHLQGRDTDKEIRSRVDRLLKETLAQWMDQSYREMNLGLSRDAIDLTNSEEKVRQFREEMLTCIRLLSEPDTRAR